MRSFHEIFVGRPDVAGEYPPPDVTEDSGKRIATGRRTVTAQVQDEVVLVPKRYEDHLSGAMGLGVVPIMEGDVCQWFALDIDDYTEPAALLEGVHARVVELGLPLIACRTKSGGVHLYCFLSEAIQAKVARTKALAFARAIGAKLLGKKTPEAVEIFPKQERWKDSHGSWINLPYFNRDQRTATSDGRNSLSLDEFLQLVERKTIAAGDLNVKAPGRARDPAAFDGPPCIERMMSESVEEGGRDNALTHVGIYFKRKYPDDWQDRVFDFNTEYVKPPLKHSDVGRVVASTDRHDYQYLCKQSPMCNLCSKEACLKRPYGIGSGDNDPGIDFVIDRIVKFSDPSGALKPKYVVTIDHKEMHLELDQLIAYAQFRRCFFGEFDRFPPPITTKQWEDFLDEAMSRLERRDYTSGLGPWYQIKTIFDRWLEMHVERAHEIEDVVRKNAPYFDRKKHEVVFLPSALLRRVAQEYKTKYDDQTVWQVVASIGAKPAQREINDKNMDVWVLQVSDPWFKLPDVDLHRKDVE